MCALWASSIRQHQRFSNLVMLIFNLVTQEYLVWELGVWYLLLFLKKNRFRGFFGMIKHEFCNFTKLHTVIKVKNGKKKKKNLSGKF